ADSAASPRRSPRRTTTGSSDGPARSSVTSSFRSGSRQRRSGPATVTASSRSGCPSWKRSRRAKSRSRSARRNPGRPSGHARTLRRQAGMGEVHGIHLRTPNLGRGGVEGGDPVVIPNTEGHRLTPSVVGFAKEGEILVGQVAKRQAITNPENTVL